MGQKVHPGGLRVGVIHDWKSNWYTGAKEFPAYLLEDLKIREHIQNKLSHAGLSDILIRKDAQRITIDIYTARPGIVIGKSGVEGYEGVSQRDQRLGDQDQARRRGGTAEGLGASREGGRGRGPDREGLGPVRQRRKGPGGPRRPGGGRGRPRGQDNVERPRTDEEATSEKGREQPQVQPEAPVVPDAVAEAPDTTTPKQQVEDPTKLEKSGEPEAEKKPKPKPKPRTKKKADS